jgi:hypothetical protein
MFMCGRLTLSTGDPICVADIASSATLYFTPYMGNRVSLYVPNYGWRVYEFTELTLDISGFTTAKNYDIFLYDNAGTLTLEGLVWSNDTLRATALYSQDGRWVKTGSLNKLYLGTIRMSGAGVTTDTLLKRFVWNNYNRMARPLKVFDSTNNWTYTTAAFRQMNNAAANKFEYVVGLVENMMNLTYIQWAMSGGANPCTVVLGIGLDSVSATTFTLGTRAVMESSNHSALATCIFNSYPSLGYHYLALLEYGASDTVFYGDDGSTNFQSGAYGWIHS